MVVSSAHAVTCQSNEFEYNGECIENKFQITTTDEASAFVFKFQISAKGTFYVDWGDGNIQQIERSNTTITQYSHSFVAGQYTIKLGGLATEYNTSSSPYTPAIRFGEDANGAGGNSASNLYSISGSLGAIFPTIGSGEAARYRPHFNTVFRNCKNLTGTIPDDLFGRIVNGVYQGISGIPIGHMFNGSFYGCSGLTGSIPSNLFSGLSGAPATSMFYQTFYGCSGLTGSIPGNLFSGISGKPANYMFYKTFNNCSGLTGPIPGNLFAGISGAPAAMMFYNTFSGCSGLTGSIPSDLFSNLSGPYKEGMFTGTFYLCSSLTGTDIDDPDNPGMKYAIPPTLFSGISGAPVINMFQATFYGCVNLTGTIPGNLFSGIQGKVTGGMFYATFYSCTKLTGPIPENLFSGIVGKLAYRSFAATFAGCINLGKDRIGGTSTYYIPPELFAGIDKTSTATEMMSGVFINTGLLNTCPSGTNQYITGFESYFNGKKSCTECPVAYPDYDTTNQQCYAQVSYMDSDDNTLLKTEDVYYDANNPNGFTLPSYSPTKPDTVLDNWTTGDGTVIGSADLLTGNQVVYSDWGFHCDSGHYFHAGNEQICTAETKRTEHALVIKPDANHTYYIHATPNSEHDYTINSSSIHKMKVNYNGTIYNLHDASVYFSD